MRYGKKRDKSTTVRKGPLHHSFTSFHLTTTVYLFKMDTPSNSGLSDLAELSSVVNNLPLDNSSSADGCYKCGKPSTQKCSRCNIARYCCKDCQVSHWPTHKKACKIDSDAVKTSSKLEANEFCFDKSCLHGAPRMSAEHAKLSEVIVGLISKINAAKQKVENINSEQASKIETDALVRFCGANKRIAITPPAAQVLIGMAVDAFMESHQGNSSEYLRYAVFLECFAKYDNDFILSFLAPDHLDAPNPGNEQYKRVVSESSTRTRLVAALKQRVTCSCMIEKASVAKDKATDAEESSSA